MPLHIVRDNIVHMKVDAIVNAANRALAPGGGVCGAIYDKAGYKYMLNACSEIGSCETGKAVITPGFNLNAKYVIHTVGPIWQGGKMGEAELLHSCYAESLRLAKEHKLNSIAFPLLSSGIYGYPKEQALHIAVSAISEFVLANEMTVYIVVYDKQAFSLSKSIFQNVESYIDQQYVDEREIRFSRARRPAEGRMTVDACCLEESMACEPTKKLRSLSELLEQREETFSQSLLRLIDERGKKDSEVYNRANIDRRLFSKIRSNANYKPSKTTVVALCIALELNLDETKDLLAKAGYSMTHSSKFDIIIEYFIEQNSYDIFEINEVLFYYGETTLGAI